MTKVNNSEIIRNITDNSRCDPFDKVPNSLNSQIVPTMEVNPQIVRYANFATGSSGTNGTVFITLPSNKDFYLLSYNAFLSKDATSDNSLVYVRCYINGAVINLTTFTGITLTAQEFGVSVNLPRPLKLDRGTTFSVANTTATVGVSRASFGIVGILVEGNLGIGLGG